MGNAVSGCPVLPPPYRVIRALAQGGQGTTWLVFDETQGLQLVVKIAPPPVIEHEASMLAQIQHPAVPRLVATFPLPTGDHGIVMEFVEGLSLENLIAQIGSQPPALVRRWAVELGKVLFLLHNCIPPLIHRDIKPANVLLCPDGHLVLVDFGIARRYKQGQSKDTDHLGSLGYVPPEQTGKAQTDGRSDLYALAATLTHCLTGYDLSLTPWKPPSLAAISDRTLVALLETSLEHDPGKRPSSASDWLRWLGEDVPVGGFVGTPVSAGDGSLLLPVPGGRFQCGPTEQVAVVSPFFLAQSPVTVGQWRQYLAIGGRGPLVDATIDADLPITGLSWFDAERYCAAYGLRLPTALEWEFAARGSDGRRYPWGQIYLPDQMVARPTATAMQPVSQRGGSPFGHCDMVGNCWEWTSIRTGLSAVACGGCYRNDGTLLACWTQQRFAADTRPEAVGVRVALTQVGGI